MDITEILLRLDALASQKGTVLVAIDGGSGSGKTTLAALLAARCDCNIFHMDDFFLRPSQRTDKRLAEVGGYVDYERFKSEVLDKLIEGTAFFYCPYDCKTQSYKDALCVSPKKISVIEGSYSQHPYFGDIWDLRIFMSAAMETRLERIRRRSGESLLESFANDWIPREDAYFNNFKIEETSDIIILNN